MDERELDNIDDEEEVSADSSEREDVGQKEPKNPNTTEAFIIVLILGVLPDVIDFFSLGAFSTFSSLVSWPLTEYYFHHKNLQVPNVRKWMRIMNGGDAVPVLGGLPLKTIGLLIAIYTAWHPKSAIAKAVKVADTATGGVKQAPTGTAAGLKQRSKEALEKIREAAGGLEEEGGGDALEPIYEKEGADESKDIYEVTREGAGGLKGPEEEAAATSFGEIISTPPQEEEVRTSRSEPPRQRQAAEATTPSAATQKNKAGEDDSSKIGGAYEEEKEIMEAMESTGEIDDILKEKPLPISPRSNPQEVQSSGDEKVVDLRRR